MDNYLENYIYNQCIYIIKNWKEDDIYAISFLVYPNELNRYKGYSNLCELSISYNTESHCKNAPLFSEERWNFAFWKQNLAYIINPQYDEGVDKGSEYLLDYYLENNIYNIGELVTETCNDKNKSYQIEIPRGVLELIEIISEVVKKIRKFLIEIKKPNIAIIIHDLEYSIYYKSAIEQANPHGEAESFLEFIYS